MTSVCKDTDSVLLITKPRVKDSCLTQMDLGRWFRHIEYLFGILNSISDTYRSLHMTKCLLKSSLAFNEYAVQYVQHTNSFDVNMMVNRIIVIIENLKLKMNLLVNSPPIINDEPNITFFELEKWKQNIMYKIGAMLSMDDSISKTNFKKYIKRGLRVLVINAINYVKKLNDNDVQKIHDIKVLVKQVINLSQSI